MNILIIGGTGTVGGRVVDRLVKRGIEPRVLVRSIERLQTLPKGVQGVAGDIKEEASLKKAMRGIDRLFLITPHSQTEAEEGISALRAAQENGVKRIVYMAAHGIHRTPDGVPHIDSKKAIERAIAASGIDYTFLEPNNFYQNDEHWFAEPMLQFGVYAQPMGSKGLSRVDAGDIADAAARVLLEDGHTGRSYALVGPQRLTGEQTAAIWSQALGREIRYAGDDLDAWAAGAKGSLPDWLLEDFVKMFAFFQKEGMYAIGDELEQTRRILGREPRPFADYAVEMAERWKDALVSS